MSAPASLVLTVLGPDYSGLVRSLSQVISQHQGNWNESHMARLAGQFAGIIHIFVPNEQIIALTQALQALQKNQLKIAIEHSNASTDVKGTLLNLEVLGHDRAGIVFDITQQLASLSVNIEEIVTEQRIASMSNETLFHAALKLRVPEEISSEQVQAVLEEMADKLMVDLHFH